jgi:hypothetical protein
MRHDEPETDRGDQDYSVVLETSAHKLAVLAQAVHQLGRLGPTVMREGVAILDACEAQIRNLSNRPSDGGD